ncbi:MAG: 50S ribosomal protein L11 methyltransferase, partial [Gemmatimonadetes bacterium]|nr:50S ribosomal protein L11 methyltransferase [Gemmatimonadota bacterium]
IERGLLLPLLPGLTATVAPGGWLLLSGILESEFAEVAATAKSAGFVPVNVDADGEWRSALFRRG